MVEGVNHVRLQFLIVLHFSSVGCGMFVGVQLDYLVLELTLLVEGLAVCSV